MLFLKLVYMLIIALYPFIYNMPKCYEFLKTALLVFCIVLLLFLAIPLLLAVPPYPFPVYIEYADMNICRSVKNGRKSSYNAGFRLFGGTHFYMVWYSLLHGLVLTFTWFHKNCKHVNIFDKLLYSLLLGLIKLVTVR